MLAAIALSPRTVRASTSESFWAVPVCSQWCSRAVLHLSVLPPCWLLMLSRKGKSNPSSRPSPCQSVSWERHLLIVRKWEGSRRRRSFWNSLHVDVQVKNMVYTNLEHLGGTKQTWMNLEKEMDCFCSDYIRGLQDCWLFEDQEDYHCSQWRSVLLQLHK